MDPGCWTIVSILSHRFPQKQSTTTNTSTPRDRLEGRFSIHQQPHTLCMMMMMMMMKCICLVLLARSTTVTTTTNTISFFVFRGSELDILLRNVSHQDGWFKTKQGMITCVCVFQSLLISYTTVCLVKNHLGYVAITATIIVNKKQSTKSSWPLHIVLPWGIKKESITKKNITKTRPKNKQTN
jgi:hypothetical protein